MIDATLKKPNSFKEVLGTDGKNYYIVSYTHGKEVEIDVKNEEHLKFFDHDPQTGHTWLPQGWYESKENYNGLENRVYFKRDIIQWEPLKPLAPFPKPYNFSEESLH